jgi:diacylglycerol kinase (ATP)
VWRTSYPGHAEALTKQAQENSLIVVVGGDGTVHEALNGLLTSTKRFRLGVIPTGSGNDFARNLGVPLEPERALASLGARSRAIDVGMFRFRDTAGTTVRRYFVNSLSMGLSARANRLAVRIRPLIGGTARYRLSAIMGLLSAPSPHFRITADGRTLLDGPALNLTFANGGRFGGGLPISPDSAPDDGVLELVIVDPLGGFRALLALERLRRGAHMGMREVRSLPLSGPVRLEHPHGSFDLEADGENLEIASDLTVEVLPGRLELAS